MPGRGRVSPLLQSSSSFNNNNNNTTTTTNNNKNTHVFNVTMSDSPDSAVSIFSVNPSIHSADMDSNPHGQGQYSTTIPINPRSQQRQAPDAPATASGGGGDDFAEDVPVFSVGAPAPDRDRELLLGAGSSGGVTMATLVEPTHIGRPSGDGMMELANFVTNSGGGKGDLPTPPIGMKKDESSEHLNLSLHQCARDGDEYNMKILIHNLAGHVKKKINIFDEDELTPLHYAARYNHLSVVKLLVEGGANTLVRGEDGITPLHHAARYRREKSKKKETPTEEEEDLGANGLPNILDQYDYDKEGSVINYLVNNGSNTNAIDIYGQTPLHFAAMRGNEVACRDLLYFRDKIQIGFQDNQGITPLHMAAIHNHLEIAHMLLDEGAELMCKDKELSTPLHLAATEGNVDLVQMLFEAGARSKEAWVTLSEMVSVMDLEGSTCLHLAVDNGHLEVAKLLLEKRADVNKPRKHFMYPIHLAAQCGNKDIVRLLVENHARIDAVNDEQTTALHRAAALDHVEVAKFLVDRGARINRRDKDNYTPLLLAATYGNTATVEMLLKKGADYTAVDKYDKTAIFLSCEENKVEVLEKLLSYPQVKKLVNDGDIYDNDPLHVAAKNGYLSIVKLLLTNGASLDTKNEEEQTPLHLAAKFGRTNIVRELIKEDKSIVNDEDESSNTALHLAAQYGHDKVAKMLLDLGADVSARNYNQWTPLDLAASKGWTKTCYVLLDQDAPVDPTDKNKTTPLHLAASSGHTTVVELLLGWEANVTLQDDEGHNCLDRAIENHQPQVALAIINSSVWKDALRNATKDPLTEYVDTPMRKLIKKMPDIAERVFDRCLSYGAEKNPERMGYEITFDYEFLDDAYARWIQDGMKRIENPDSSEFSSSTGSSIGGDDDGRLPPGSKKYTPDTNVLKKNHPMSIMVSSKREDLLAHPLVTSLLSHKWNTFGRFFYYLSFFIYCIFLTFLTGYMTSTDPPLKYTATDRKLIEDNECKSITNPPTQNLFCRIGTYAIIALAAFNVLKELLQIYQAKLNYLGWTNIIEWITYISALLFVISFNDCQRDTGYRYEWQWNLGAISVFLAWLDLVLIIQKVPQLGIYVVMFTDILFTFSQFFIVFFLFIIAFALAFYALFQDQGAFASVGKSMIKTSVMMIGEFEFDAIFNGDHDVGYPAASYIIWVIFLVIMSILIMNLLVGLAVDDIKAVQEQAALKRLAMQVELALNVERIIPEFILQKQYVRRKTIRPNTLRNPLMRFINSSSSISAEALQKTLNPELDEIEKVQESQEKIGGDVKKLKRAMKDIQEQNQKLESMLMAIVVAQGIQWQEEDYQEEDGMEMMVGNDGGV